MQSSLIVSVSAGVDKYLAMIIEQEPLSPGSVNKGNGLRSMLAKTLEKANGVGKRIPMSPPPQQPMPSLPPKPGPGAPAIQVENSPDADFDQEDYTEMDAEQRPRLDTSASLYLDMKPDQANPEVVDDEFYTDMESLQQPPSAGPKPGQLQSQKQQEPAVIDEDFYTDMETASAALAPPTKDTDAASFGSQEEYTAMEGTGQIVEEDMYQDADELVAPRPVQVGGTGTMPPKPNRDEKPRAATMPAESSGDSVAMSGDGDEDPYGLGADVKPVAATSIAKTAGQRGFLEKLGGATGKSWQKRYVVLHDLTLYFYASGKDKRQRNQIAVMGYTVSAAPDYSTKKKFAFKLTPAKAEGKGKKKEKKSYYFRANSNDERNGWIGALRAALVTVNRRSKSFLDGAVTDGNMDNLDTSSAGDRSSEIVEESFYEDPIAANQQQKSTSPALPEQDEYLVPSEQLSGGSTSTTSSQPQEDYLAPEELSRPASTFNPYASRQQVVRQDLTNASNNPYASRQQAMSDYASRKQLQKLPPTPDQNPYAASRKQMGGLPPVPPTAPTAPTAPIAPTSRDYVDTQSIFVQKPDKPSFASIYVALWDYRGGEDDELSFKRGDLIFIEDRLDDLDWWVGVKRTPNDIEDFTGERGLLVSSYVSPAYEQLI